MAGTKISALPAGVIPAAADLFPTVQGGITSKVTAAQLRQGVGAGGAAIATVAGAYAVDTYLAGSAIVAPAGSWQIGAVVPWIFHMTKTAAGVATFTLTPPPRVLGPIA